MDKRLYLVFFVLVLAFSPLAKTTAEDVFAYKNFTIQKDASSSYYYFQEKIDGYDFIYSAKDERTAKNLVDRVRDMYEFGEYRETPSTMYYCQGDMGECVETDNKFNDIHSCDLALVQDEQGLGGNCYFDKDQCDQACAQALIEKNSQEEYFGSVGSEQIYPAIPDDLFGNPKYRLPNTAGLPVVLGDSFAPFEASGVSGSDGDKIAVVTESARYFPKVQKAILDASFLVSNKDRYFGYGFFWWKDDGVPNLVVLNSKVKGGSKYHQAFGYIPIVQQPEKVIGRNDYWCMQPFATYLNPIKVTWGQKVCFPNIPMVKTMPPSEVKANAVQLQAKAMPYFADKKYYLQFRWIEAAKPSKINYSEKIYLTGPQNKTLQINTKPGTEYCYRAIVGITDNKVEKQNEGQRVCFKTPKYSNVCSVKRLEVGKVKLGRALQIARQISERVAIRPGFLLGIASQESGLNHKPTTDYYPMHELCFELGQVGGWQCDTFYKITSLLGLKRGEVGVSAPADGVYGGAMGISQFMPGTWMANRVAARENIKKLWNYTVEPSPWNICEGLTFSATKLSGDGADKKTECAEKMAAQTYYHGHIHWLFKPLCLFIDYGNYSSGVSDFTFCFNELYRKRVWSSKNGSNYCYYKTGYSYEDVIQAIKEI
ncbi:MAG: hypothetical protein WC449_01390 [Candidatus Paceibacterota bacterium]